MSFLSILTGGLLFKGGRAEQITADCDGLAFGERNAAIKKARELDEMMKSATIQELFKARQGIASRLNPQAPPGVIAWVHKMILCMDQEIVLRSEFALGPQRRDIINEQVKKMTPEDRRHALEWTRQKRKVIAGLNPFIDKELAEDERVLSGAA